VEEVLKRLKENDLFLKPEKCEFKKKEIEFLGMIIGEEGVKMDMTKVEAIMSCPTLKCVKDCPSIFGTCQLFYPPLLFKISQKIATPPLNNLTRKETYGDGGETQQKVFDELKKRFVEGPIFGSRRLHAPVTRGVRRFRFCEGAVLSMLCEDEKWHPCAFLSKV